MKPDLVSWLRRAVVEQYALLNRLDVEDDLSCSVCRGPLEDGVCAACDARTEAERYEAYDRARA